MNKSLCVNDAEEQKPLLGVELMKRLKRDLLQNENAKDSELTAMFPCLTSQVMSNYKSYNRGFSLGVVVAIKETDPRLQWDWLIKGVGTPYPWGYGKEQAEETKPLTSMSLNVEKTYLAKRLEVLQTEQIITRLQEQINLLQDVLKATDVYNQQQQQLTKLLNSINNI